MAQSALRQALDAGSRNCGSNSPENRSLFKVLGSNRVKRLSIAISMSSLAVPTLTWSTVNTLQKCAVNFGHFFITIWL